MKTLTKLDGTVVELGRGRPKANWQKQPDGNYKEAEAINAVNDPERDAAYAEHQHVSDSDKK